MTKKPKKPIISKEISNFLFLKPLNNESKNAKAQTYIGDDPLNSLEYRLRHIKNKKITKETYKPKNHAKN